MKRADSFCQSCIFKQICSSKCKMNGEICPEQVLYFRKGELISSNYEKPRYIYVLLSGTAALITYMESGERMLIGIPSRGNSFGEAFHLCEDFPVEFRALTDVSVCRFPADALVEQEEAVRSNIVMHAEMKGTEGTYRLLWIRNAQRVYERIRRALIVMASLNGRERNDREYVSVSHEDLALLVNTDRPTVTRALHKLEREGFLSLGYQKLHVRIPTTDFRKEPLFDALSISMASVLGLKPDRK